MVVVEESVEDSCEKEELEVGLPNDNLEISEEEDEGYVSLDNEENDYIGLEKGDEDED